MTKSRKHNSKKRTHKLQKYTIKHKNSMGGAYTQDQRQQLLNLGFTPEFLQIVDRAKVGFDMLLNNFQESGLTAQQYMAQTYEDLDMNPDEGFTDVEDDDEDNEDNDEENNMDDQEGGKRKRKNHKKSKTKKSKTKKSKTKKRKLYNKKGGTLYGKGYGANCNDPNNSIYNTNMLKLFPYSAK
jgi:hypothetical protein